MTTPSTEPTRPAPHLQDLASSECWDLLRTRPVGRLVWNGAAGITAVPMNYVVSGSHLLVRVTSYSSVARECDDSAVAFQVDEVDAEEHRGWSVLARGRASLIYPGADDRLDEHPDNAHADVEVWPSGPRPLHLSIDVADISGRRLGT